MKLASFSNFLLKEDPTNKEAALLGLKSVGFGYYADASGNITHKQRGGKLQPVDGPPPTIDAASNDALAMKPNAQQLPLGPQNQQPMPGAGITGAPEPGTEQHPRGGNWNPGPNGDNCVTGQPAPKDVSFDSFVAKSNNPGWIAGPEGSNFTNLKSTEVLKEPDVKSNAREHKLSFGIYLREGPMMPGEKGNPTPGNEQTGAPGQTPAQKAKQLGLISNGNGTYRDQSGQTVAMTVGGELTFIDPQGGAVTDSGGGAALIAAKPTHSDPETGMAITPPAKPESPEEIAAVPTATPAQAPAGYNAFMQKKKEAAYERAAMQQEVDRQQDEVDNIYASDPILGAVQQNAYTTIQNFADSGNPDELHIANNLLGVMNNKAGEFAAAMAATPDEKKGAMGQAITAYSQALAVHDAVEDGADSKYQAASNLAKAKKVLERNLSPEGKEQWTATNPDIELPEKPPRGAGQPQSYDNMLSAVNNRPDIAKPEPPKKKPAAKKPAAKTAAKKPAAKKPAAKKTTTTKKPAASKPAAKKEAPKKPAPKKEAPKSIPNMNQLIKAIERGDKESEEKFLEKIRNKRGPKPDKTEAKPEPVAPPPKVDKDQDGIDDRVESYLNDMVKEMTGSKRQTTGMKKIMERLNHPVAGKRIRDFIKTAISEDKRQRQDYQELSQFNDTDGALKFMTEGLGLQLKNGRLVQGTPNRELRSLGGAGMPGEGRGESRAIGFREHQALMDPDRQELIRNAAKDGGKSLHAAALQNDISWDTATQIYDMMENSMQRKADTWGKPEAAQGTFTPMGPVEFLKDGEGNFTGETNIDALARTNPEEYAKHFSNNGGNRGRGIFSVQKMLSQAARGEFSGVPSFFDFDTSTPDHIKGRSSGQIEGGRFKDDPMNLGFDRRGLNQFKVSSQFENDQGERERDTLNSLLNAVGNVKGSLGKVERDGIEYEDMMDSPNFKKWLAYRMEQSDFDPKKIASRSGEGGIQAYPDSLQDFMGLDDAAIKQLVGKNEQKNPLGLNFRNMSMLAPRPDQRPLTANTWGGAPGGGLEFNPLQGYRRALTAGALFNPQYRQQLQQFEEDISTKNWTDERKAKEVAKKRRDIIAENIFGPQKAAGSLYGMGQIGNQDFVEKLRENATNQLSWMQEENPEEYKQLMEGLNSTLDGYRGDLDKKMPEGPYRFTEEELAPNMKESYLRAVMGSNYGRSKMPPSLVKLFDQEQGAPKKLVEDLDDDEDMWYYIEE